MVVLLLLMMMILLSDQLKMLSSTIKRIYIALNSKTTHARRRRRVKFVRPNVTDFKLRLKLNEWF